MRRSFFNCFLLLLVMVSGMFAQTFTRGYEYCAHRKQNSSNVFINEKANLPHTFNVLNYKIYLDIYNCFISPYPKSFTANVVITARADSAIASIDLNAVNTSLVIDGVSMSGASFTHANNILKVNLDRAYNPGEIFDVKINYRHNNVSDNAVYVSAGFFFTDCEPEGARKWVPCWDKPSDKATFDLTARTPATVKLGSNGRLADSTKIQDTIYYRWISRDNIATYLMVISAKVNYNLDIVYWKKLSNPNDSIPMRFYWNTGESTTNLNAIKNVIGPMTTYFSQKFTEHPFEKNGFATLNNQFTWGGMENQTLTSLCPNCWSENLVSHEFAHQWFGDMITCATWADITLNEGFATFCEALWYEKTGGYAAYKQDIVNDASSYMSSNPGWPIYNPSWAVTTPNTNTLFNTAITYNKGACVLHMLRYVMGDTLFFRGLREYANHPSLKYQSAVLEDLKNVMSGVYGQDLGWFFDSWYKQPNHPTYQNKYFISQSGTQWVVGFIANQNQTNTPFHPMPLEIKISFTGGTDTTIRVFNSVNEQQFTWRFGKQPTAVAFDPNNEIVLKTAALGSIAAGPGLVTPPNNASVASQPVTLSWTAVSGATQYKVQVSLDPLFSSFAVNETSTTPGYTLGTLANQTRYYWRIAAVVSGVSTAFSETWAFTLGSNCRDVAMLNGWNLVSTPFQAANMGVTALYPQANSPAYGFSNGYTQTDAMQLGKGYWLRYPAAQTVTICGNLAGTNQITLQAGWNLIGGYQNNVPVSAITTVPADIITSFFYGYNEGYIQETNLSSGKGYWIRVNQAGTLVLPNNTAIEKSGGVTNNVAKETAKIVFKDSKGRTATLYLTEGAQKGFDRNALPPLPPQGIFDVRFASESGASPLGTAAKVLLQGCEFPVKVSVENARIQISDAMNAGIISAEACPGMPVTIADSRVEQLLIESSVSMPTQYALYQNYPNPFNPETMISFSMASRGNVTLEVFNQLGEKTADLAAGLFEPGHHEVKWSAAGLPSGIYFCEMKTNDFRSVIKMVVMR